MKRVPPERPERGGTHCPIGRDRGVYKASPRMGMKEETPYASRNRLGDGLREACALVQRVVTDAEPVDADKVDGVDVCFDVEKA
jgi:hypothetical protein